MVKIQQIIEYHAFGGSNRNSVNKTKYKYENCTAGSGLEAAKQFLANGAKAIITGRNQGKLNTAKKIIS